MRVPLAFMDALADSLAPLLPQRESFTLYGTPAHGMELDGEACTATEESAETRAAEGAS